MTRFTKPHKEKDRQFRFAMNFVNNECNLNNGGIFDGTFQDMNP